MTMLKSEEQTMKELKELKVSDLGLASYLKAHAYRLVRVEGPPSRRLFVFEASEEAVLAYYADTDRTSARKLLAAWRDMRGLTHQMF